MSKVDDELTRRLQRAERPMDGVGQFEQIVRRRQRLEVARKAQIGALAVAVLALTTGGFVALTSTFGDPPAPIGTSPHPILPKKNGLLAFADGSSLFTISPDGGETSRVAGIPEGAWSPAWSPDGTRLAVAIFPLGPGPRELWVVNADGSDATKLVEADNVSQPSWSPDGSMIAYAADDDDGSAIHVIGADGTGDRVVGEVLHGPDYFSAAFSPDGTQILFDKGTDVGFAIFVMASDGTQSTRLSAGDRDYSPSWSPDGTEIAFTRHEDSMESDIFVMEAEGTGVRRVTDGHPGETNLGPVWAPDGTQIAYQSGRTGGPGGLVLTRPDGSDPHEIVQDGVLGIAWQPLPGHQSPAPDSDSVDIGLDVPMCDVDILDGIDWYGDGTAGAAWTGARVTPDGRCPDENTGEYVVAADLDGDGKAEPGGMGFLSSCLFCHPYATTDLDADGVLELVVQEEGSSTPSYSIYEVSVPTSERSPGIYNLFVAPPGHPEARIRPGKPLRIFTGGDEGFAGWVGCSGQGGELILEITWRDHPVEGDIQEVHETDLALRHGIFQVVAGRDYELPVGVPVPRASDEPACGVDWQI